MLQDLRFALRLLNRHRGYAALAILTIAVGVGANAAVFSVADSVLFRPLPFPDADRLFALRLADPVKQEVYGTLPGEAVEAARESGILDAVAPVSSRAWRAYVREGGALEALSLAPVSPQYLDLLGVRPALGRALEEGDTGTHALMLTWQTWMRRYGGDRAVIGRLVPAILRPTESYPLTQQPLRIVGVLPPRVRLPLIADTDALVLDQEAPGAAGRWFAPLVRLRADVTPAAAQAALEGVRAPELKPGQSVLRLVPLREELARRQDAVLWLLLGASAIVLLAAAVNLANLLVARGAARTRELAVRSALGGSRARLARLLLVEAGVLAFAGTLAGLAVAYAGFRGLAAALPSPLARVADPAFDARALVFGFAAALVCAAMFSIMPALRLSRADARHGVGLAALQRNPSRRGRRILVAVEVACCVALLVGAALVGRTLHELLTQDLGFQPNRLAVTFDLPTMVVKRGDTMRTDTAARAAFYRARLLDVRSVPGVRAAALASSVPFSGMAPDAPLTDRDDQPGGVYSVSSGYFRTMGVPVLAGRELSDDESFSNAGVGVLNESGARLLCGGLWQCLGATVRAPGQPARTVVGIVRDTRPSARRAATPAMFVPFESSFALKTLVIDAEDTQATRDALRRALAVSSDVRVNVRSIDADLDAEVAPFRFNALVVAAFAAMTLLLAIVGVYGVMSALVGERIGEYAIRLALGATNARVSGLVLRQALVPIAGGLGAGLLLAVWSTRFIASLLYGVAPLDVGSFLAGAGIVLASGLVAALLPARRAGSVDPIVVLKTEC